MIRADKEGLWGKVVRAYIERKVRGMFRGLWLDGELPAANAQGLLIYGNHPGFWDGFILHQLCVTAGWDGHCLMDEDNLARYRFLTKIGAFSIQKRQPHSVARSLAYARALLKQGKTVFVLPEGELNPGSTLKPFHRGIELLARSSGAVCVPLALRYAFLEHERPDVLLALGPPHSAGPLSVFADTLERLVHTQAIVTSTAGRRCLVQGSRGAAERWDAVRAWTKRMSRLGASRL